MTKTIEQEAHDSLQQVVAKVAGRDVTRGELSAAFNRVARRDNWKMPINCTVDLTTHFEMALIREAVVFFTGSVPTFEAVAIMGSRCRYRVRAPGYYATIGA